MKIAKGMKDLTRDIRSSSEQRAEDLTNIKEGTAALRENSVEMVQDFHDSRRKSGGTTA